MGLHVGRRLGAAAHGGLGKGVHARAALRREVHSTLFSTCPDNMLRVGVDGGHVRVGVGAVGWPVVVSCCFYGCNAASSYSSPTLQRVHTPLPPLSHSSSPLCPLCLSPLPHLSSPFLFPPPRRTVTPASCSLLSLLSPPILLVAPSLSHALPRTVVTPLSLPLLLALAASPRRCLPSHRHSQTFTSLPPLSSTVILLGPATPQ